MRALTLASKLVSQMNSLEFVVFICFEFTDETGACVVNKNANCGLGKLACTGINFTRQIGITNT